MKKTINKKNNNNSFQQKKEAEKKVEKNYAEKEIIRYTKNYTNEHICKQIEENCIMFRIIMGMLAFAFLLILISCIRAFEDIYPKVSLYLWLSELRNNHAVGPVFGTTFIILAGVGIHEFDSFNMIKHIRPLCSGKRYSASRIDELANHPETIWLKEAGVFVTPKGLIGINKGITVVDYDDIAGFCFKGKHHMEKTTNGANRGRMSAGRAAYYALTDHYDEWETYYFKIKTKKHRKLLLTEVAYIDDTNRLVQIIKDRCPGIELPEKA